MPGDVSMTDRGEAEDDGCPHADADGDPERVQQHAGARFGRIGKGHPQARSGHYHCERHQEPSACPVPARSALP